MKIDRPKTRKETMTLTFKISSYMNILFCGTVSLIKQVPVKRRIVGRSR